MKENTSNQKPTYKAPVVFGVKESEVTAASANRYMGGTGGCCYCSGAGHSRT